jgi:hypothetical protein
MRIKLVLLSLALSGCSYSTFYVPVERLVYQPSNPAAIAVSTQKTLSQPHKILGRVATITWGAGRGGPPGRKLDHRSSPGKSLRPHFGEWFSGGVTSRQVIPLISKMDEMRGVR